MRVKKVRGLKRKTKGMVNRIIEQTTNFPVDLWNSQIIIFAGDRYFEDFFERNTYHQKWLQLSKESNIESEWGVAIPDAMDVLGIREEITEEDGEIIENEIWFIGELKSSV
ncbi:DUF3916 domain-containing protein [Bacillus sp. FJAT-42315]|uniref:DUF3916 domain-containing protein n=1 Tax=Bacillus sp. FJAT-42315 TaxID=2014077 RepID=UPI000C24874A|nr:DUF3916 domain-containing protein [Bacillus sp. FJAT-42315]